ncbi:enoyl-CoA hydratase/isomerase family protein [Leeuwenhoekiella polynyae]|uniref:Enoyl-CoA hydratase/carnithine racemase n=1 Tax=Leeuwenhoekiella polynyae TaxID=1550906 RepID=A0A4Q0PHA8_9FLAO|nr:enoyl-CoA hydratase/isomerase family protein [Leeuwenhoekiella polynyae]RXG26305.1 enoyl-CoA hydratase/carnithine racemase [Leeuwenhoekiella polynyae]
MKLSKLNESQFKTLSISLNDGVAEIVLNSGSVNALGSQMIKELRELLHLLEKDNSVKVIVFDSANPDFFIAHVDMRILEDKKLFDKLVEETPEGVNLFQSVGEMIRTQPQVTIVKLKGIARGGGAEFVTSSDMIFASIEKGKLSHNEALMGILPGGGGTQYLQERMTRNRVMEITLGADLFDAVTAERYGWINRALPHHELDLFVNSLAKNIANLPDGVVKHMKQLVPPAGNAEGLIAEHNAWLTLISNPIAGQIMSKALENGAQTVEGELELEKLLRA